ncbi:MAG TPA: hypothetical protein DCS93_34740 [Microscillaceae bacterium]|nr:hypothetical protein [Microscillaceae bacterium]
MKNTNIEMDTPKELLRKLTIAIILMVAFLPAQAQISTYSQYHLSPMQTNPAMLGSYNQPFAMLSYRQLSLGSGFVSSNAAFETPMISVMYPLKSKNKGRFGGTGFSIINDRSGGGGLLQTTGLQAGFAYNQQLSKTSFLSMGVQGGYLWQNLNPAKLTTGSQWVDGQFLSTIDNNESIIVEPVNYPTASAGLYWYGTDNDSTASVKYFLGVSGQNLNQPNTAFGQDQQDRLPINLVVTAGYTVFDNQTIKVMPTLRWVEQVGFNRQINAGALGWYRLNNGTEEKANTQIGMGLWYNSNGMANVSVELDQPHYMVALAYGFAASKKAPQLSSFEIKLGIKIGKSFTKNVFRKRDRKARRKKRREKKKQDKKKKIEGQEITPPQISQKKEKEKHLEILKGAVYFQYNKNELLNSNKAYLNQVVSVLNKYPEINLVVQGHTCKITQTEVANQKLSEGRAETVKDYLIDHGIDASRLETIGFGSQKPVASNDDAYGQLRNRRVQFEVIDTKPSKKAPKPKKQK